MICAGLVGQALDGQETVIENCGVTLTAKASPATAFMITSYTFEVTVGDLVANGSVLSSGCSSSVMTDELTGNEDKLLLTVVRLADEQ